MAPALSTTWVVCRFLSGSVLNSESVRVTAWISSCCRPLWSWDQILSSTPCMESQPAPSTFQTGCCLWQWDFPVSEAHQEPKCPRHRHLNLFRVLQAPEVTLCIWGFLAHPMAYQLFEEQQQSFIQFYWRFSDLKEVYWAPLRSQGHSSPSQCPTKYLVQASQISSPPLPFWLCPVLQPSFEKMSLWAYLTLYQFLRHPTFYVLI